MPASAKSGKLAASASGIRRIVTDHRALVMCWINHEEQGAERDRQAERPGDEVGEEQARHVGQAHRQPGHQEHRAQG